MLLRMAWRNLWRTKRRTIITVLAMSLGVMGIVALHSYQRAAYDEMVAGVTRGMIGHVQVVGPGWREAPDLGTVVADAVVVEARLRAALPAAGTEKRVLGAALAGAGDRSAGVSVTGIEPGNTDGAALLTIEAGRPLGPAPAREAVVGSGLARELGVAPGDELVLFGQAADGSLANDRFLVVGVGDAGSYDANAVSVFVHIADAQSFFSLEDGAHQIIVRLPGESVDPEGTAGHLREALAGMPVEVWAWGEILPELKKTMEQKMKQQHAVDFIVFLIVALGVLNTTTMSTFERTREFGVMASLGTRRGRILGLVVTETLIQGLLGFTLGMGAAAAILAALSPVDLSGVVQGDVLGARMPDQLILRIHGAAVLSAGVTTLLTMLAGSLLPAWRASRLKPAEAARYV